MLVGEAGLQRTTVDGQPAVEVGWTLMPEHWGKGFASEAAAGALDYGFRRAGLRSIVALTLPANSRSLAVMTRLGMKPEGEVLHGGLPHVIYRVVREVVADLAAPGPARQIMNGAEPPSTDHAAPVTNAAWTEQRKTMAAATSSSPANLPEKRIFARRASRTSSREEPSASAT